MADSLEQKVIALAGTYGNSPSEFISTIEKLIANFRPEKKASALYQIATILVEKSYLRLAYETFLRSLAYFKQKNDKAGQSSCLGSIGTVLRSLGNYKKALEFQEATLLLKKELGDLLGESRCYTNIGNIFQGFGDFQKALSYHKMALELKERIADHEALPVANMNIGADFSYLSDNEKAAKYFERALELAKKLKDRRTESACYMNLGHILTTLGKYSEAIELMEKSLRIDDEIGDRQRWVTCKVNIGNNCMIKGDYEQAIKIQEDAQKIANAIGDRVAEADCYGNLGIIYFRIGQYQKALEFHNISLSVKKEIGEMHGEANSYSNIGVVQHMIGQYDRAVENYTRGLTIFQKIGDKEGESSCYGNIGVTMQSIGKYEESIGFFEKALAIKKEIGEKLGEANSYMNIGNTLQMLDKYEESIVMLEKALAIFVEIKNKQGELECYTNLGATYGRMGRTDSSVAYHDKALVLAREVGDIYSVFANQSNLAQNYLESNPHQACEKLREAIDATEILAANLVEEEHKLEFRASVIFALKLIVILSLKLGKNIEAFHYVQRSKSRTLLDNLAYVSLKPSVQITGELGKLLDEEHQCINRLKEISAIHKRSSYVSPAPGETSTLLSRLTRIYDQIEKHDYQYVSLRRARPQTLEQIQTALIKQGKKAVLLEYFVTAQKVFVFVITRNSFHVEEAKSADVLSQSKLLEFIRNYEIEVHHRQDQKELTDNWLKIADYLIAPVSKYISEAEVIYIIPHGLLHYLPLHAMKMNGEYLARKCPIVYLPSASLLQFHSGRTPEQLVSCAAFALDRDKEGYLFSAEAKAVSAIFGSSPIVDSSKDELFKHGDKNILHFATHGYFDYADPLSSGIEFKDGILTARELLHNRIGAELVTLSACETGLNETKPGDELIGLTRSILYSGAASMLVSLWPVSDDSTYLLMLEFYKELKRQQDKGERIDKAMALQQAQIKVMDKPNFAHPYYWAAFILVGDWR